VMLQNISEQSTKGNVALIGHDIEENSNVPQRISDNVQETELQNVLLDPLQLTSNKSKSASNIASEELGKFDNSSCLRAMEMLDKQYVNYASPPIHQNSYFTREAYGRYSQYSLRRVYEMSVDHQRTNNMINDNHEIADKGTSSAVDKECSSIIDTEVPSIVDKEIPSIVDKEIPSIVDKEIPSIIDKEIPSIIDKEIPSIVDKEVPSTVNKEVPIVVDQEAHQVINSKLPEVLPEKNPIYSDEDDLVMDDQSDGDDAEVIVTQRKNSEQGSQHEEASNYSRGLVAEQSHSQNSSARSTIKETRIDEVSSAQAKSNPANNKPDEKLQAIESQDSYDVIGPYLQLLGKHKKQSERPSVKRDSNNSINSSTQVASTPVDTASVSSDASHNSPTTTTPYSKMSHEQHINFLRLTLLSETNSTLLTEPDWGFISVMKERFREEREEYIQWMYNRSQERIVYLDQKIANQLERHFTSCVERVTKNYPRFYEVSFTMGLALPSPSPDEPVLKFSKTIKRVGTCYKFRLQLPTPSHTLKVPLEREYRSFNTNFADNNHAGSTDSNTLDEKQNQQSDVDMVDVHNQTEVKSPNNVEPIKVPKKYWQKMSMPVVSRDPLIPLMVIQHKVNIVISSSSLCALVALQASADVEIELPIRVTESKDSDTVLKTVYVDKPLLKRHMTPRQRNQNFYDIAFESMAFDLGVDVNDVFNNSMGNVHNLVSPESQKKDEKMENCSLTKIGSCSNSDKPIDSTCHEILSDEHLRSGNLIYNLWNFGDMVILIRCKAHSYIQESNNDSKNRIIGVKTKLEYQLDLGSEEITNLERARWWIYTYIRNNAHLILGHVNVPANELVDIQRMRMADIIPDGNWPRPHSKMLHHVLKKLQCLPVGSYLFSHEKGDPHATVYKSAEISSLTNQVQYSSEPNGQTLTILPEVATHLYDLHRAHSQSPLLDLKTVPFVLIKWSGLQNQVPYTFPIRPPEKRLVYCFDFIKFGKCDKTDCVYPHLSKEQCELSGLKTNYCFVFADTGKCENRNESTNPLDLDDKNMVESSGTSLAPDFEMLLREFNS
ncbi:7389_t:CDS:10, partial [Acaulospora morrowiae]